MPRVEFVDPRPGVPETRGVNVNTTVATTGATACKKHTDTDKRGVCNKFIHNTQHATNSQKNNNRGGGGLSQAARAKAGQQLMLPQSGEKAIIETDDDVDDDDHRDHEDDVDFSRGRLRVQS